MNLLRCGLTLFALPLFLHWLIWRWHVPRRQTAGLLAIFVGCLIVGLLAAAACPSLHAYGPHGFWEHLHVCLFGVALSLSYIVLYSAIEADSPSMTLVKFVAQAGAHGRRRQEFSQVINNERLVTPRLQALVRDKLVKHTGGTYRLTPKGEVLARIFTIAAAVLGLGKGG